MGRVKNVCYDLILALERNSVPYEVVYRREGLPTPEHKVEIKLRSKTCYFWTVRARFEMDGRQRVTEWSSTHFNIRDRHTPPTSSSYLFKTP